MDEAVTGAHGFHSTPSRGSRSLVRQATEPDITDFRENKIAILERENAELLKMKESTLRKLSRNGEGTISNIETVVARAVRERDELRAENQNLRTEVLVRQSCIITFKGVISTLKEKLVRAQTERIAMARSKQRWITRMFALAGRVPGELRKKDAEIDNMREKLAGMEAQLSEEQFRLQDLQGQLQEEREGRAGAEAELDRSRLAHTREIAERDLAGRRLRDQLKQVVENLDSGAMSM